MLTYETNKVVKTLCLQNEAHTPPDVHCWVSSHSHHDTQSIDDDFSTHKAKKKWVIGGFRSRSYGSLLL